MNMYIFMYTSQTDLAKQTPASTFNIAHSGSSPRPCEVSGESLGSPVTNRNCHVSVLDVFLLFLLGECTILSGKSTVHSLMHGTKCKHVCG